MKVTFVATMDLDSGEFQVEFRTDEEEQDVDYEAVVDTLYAILEALDKEVEGAVEDEEDERATKLLH